MPYIDTSVLAAYYCPEAASSRIEKTLEKTANPTISQLVETELYSAVARKVRMKEMTRQDGNLILSQFNLHLEQRLYRMLPVETRHYHVAREWIGRFDTALRTLDALHLAIAYSENLTLLSADHHLCKAADYFGISVQSV
ncbi:hypothetical protein PDESU_01519 [Pontiella desulfatans]|uniref:Ribonuclease VapC n=1 Tax=Pontiella desulfatans TaxID=2750659 RepID=A0A6C2TZD6_PONDE|nr:type II toxin-antitoxin system VapC family toxin [Pontiella desulfatans]VGO12965.1 hypothetical protein PDESU_01519 [Pontiella desulfatans]